MSDHTAQIVDEEVRRIVDNAYERATYLLTTHRDELNRVAKALLEYETLSGDEIKTLAEGGKIDRPEAPPPEQKIIKPKPISAVPIGGETTV